MSTSKQTHSTSHNKQTWYKQPWFVWTRDISIAAVVLLSISMWQTRDMLSTAGDVQVAQQNLLSLQGEIAPMLSEEKDNLVYFFAPWCAICDMSIRNLNYLNQDKINIVVIALDYQTKEEVEAFIHNNPLDSKVYLGNAELKQSFQIQGYPSYYLVDKHGLVLSRSYGYSSAVGLKLREVFGK